MDENRHAWVSLWPGCRYCSKCGSNFRLQDLSPEARAARAPLPPGDLVDALQDTIHKDIGRSRAARTVRNKKKMMFEKKPPYHEKIKSWAFSFIKVMIKIKKGNKDV